MLLRLEQSHMQVSLSDSDTHQLSPAQLVLFHGCADLHAWTRNFLSHPPASWTTCLAPLQVHSHAYAPYLSIPLHTAMPTQSIKHPSPALPQKKNWNSIPHTAPLLLIPWTNCHANVCCTCQTRKQRKILHDIPLTPRHCKMSLTTNTRSPLSATPRHTNGTYPSALHDTWTLLIQ